MQKLGRDTITFGAGAAVGVTQTILFKQYLDTYGPIPFIGGLLPYPWGNWSTLGNILIGGVVFGVSQFTSWVTNYDLKSFLGTYGITTLVGGILNGVFPGGTVPTARRAAARLAPAVRSARAVSPATPTGIPTGQILS